jgi:hypothetical protein
MRLIVLLFFVLIFFGTCLAQTTTEVSVEKIITIEATARKVPLETQINQLRQKIDQLERSVRGIKIAKEKTRVKKIIAQYRWELEGLEAQRIPILSIAAAVSQETEKATEGIEQKYVARKRRFTINLAGGFFSGVMGVNAGLIFPQRIPKIGPSSSALRITCGLAQNLDGKRKYLPLAVDGILNFPAGWITGEDSYVGVGINYTLLTTGRKAGTFGGEIFYGVVSEGFGGNIFGELGYGALRSGISPQQDGVSLLVGYQKEIFH